MYQIENEGARAGRKTRASRAVATHDDAGTLESARFRFYSFYVLMSLYTFGVLSVSFNFGADGGDSDVPREQLAATATRNTSLLDLPIFDNEEILPMSFYTAAGGDGAQPPPSAAQASRFGALDKEEYKNEPLAENWLRKLHF